MELHGLTDRFVKIKTELLVKAHWNYKEEDAELQEKLVANIKANGQLENIIVRELPTGAFEVVNGNHRFDAFKELGFDEVVVCNLGQISDANAQAIAIATNETRFRTNTTKLNSLLKEISKTNPLDELAKIMPYSAPMLQDMVGSVDFNFDQFNTDGQLPPLKKPDAPLAGKLTIELPIEEVEEFRHQIKRIKKLLYPDDHPEDVADGAAWTAILHCVINAEDSFFK